MSTGIYAQPGNRTLSRARAAKQDEFYTQLADIADEPKHHKPHFKGKVVLCYRAKPIARNIGHISTPRFIPFDQGRLTWTSYPSSPASKPLSMFSELSCQP